MTLTATACALLGLVAWALVLVLLLVNQRGLMVLTGKMKVNAFAPDGSNTPSDFGQRLVRVHANCLENLPLQAAVLLYAIAAGQTALTDPLAGLLLGCPPVPVGHAPDQHQSAVRLAALCRFLHPAGHSGLLAAVARRADLTDRLLKHARTKKEASGLLFCVLPRCL